MRDIVILACVDCKKRNYNTTKNKRNQPGRIEYQKFCPTCRHHTTHKETR